MMKTRLLVASVVLALFAACSSAPENKTRGAPAWIQQPTRTVDNSYIVYVGSAEDVTPDRANFKAEAVAIQDVANECSFAPKGTRVEDRYNSFAVGNYTAYAKVAITIDDCEAAKQTIDPEKIKAVANVAMTDQLAHYQQMEYNVPQAGQQVAEADEPVTGGGGGSGANPAIYSTGAPPPIQSTGEFFIIRQQVAYQKQVVIMAPPGAYPPGSPQTQTFVRQVQPATTQVQTFEHANPQTRTWQNSWSGFERNPTAPLPRSMQRRNTSASMPGRPGGGYGNRGQGRWQNRGQNPPQQRWNGGGRRRRRQNPQYPQ